MSRIRAAFLDRDGVLNRRPPLHRYVTSVDELEILPGVGPAVALLRGAGFLPIVVSNQRGIARGEVSERTLLEIEGRLRDAGVQIEGFYYCRHDLGAACACRKPYPGLLLEAARNHAVDLLASVMIGDEESDVEAGRAAGCHTVRIGPAGAETTADRVAPDLPAAVQIVVAQWGPGSARPATAL
jgi:D-glycero-D-manno-heptose 1,7-bisphosphate phosphatase